MGYVVKILADSVSVAGHRITTFEATFPRFILAEVNTHNMIAKSSASSRAIPIPKKIAAVVEDPFVPRTFGRNGKGMQPVGALEGDEARVANSTWHAAKSDMIAYAQTLADLGVHKQYANRLIELFGWHTAILTGTDWSNLFNLRDNDNAQGEFHDVAAMMRWAYESSSPIVLGDGDWHLPLVRDVDQFDLEVAGKKQRELAPISAARCARTSYLTHHGVRDIEEDLGLYGRLLAPGHMSPLEHTARPMSARELVLTESWDVAFDDGPMIRTQAPRGSPPRVGMRDGAYTITRVRGPLNYCGKFNGWCSLRSTVPGEWDILGERAKEATVVAEMHR